MCLPNGFCHGPRKFTKLLKPILAELRKLDHIIAAYIDDMLNIGEDYNDCARNVIDCIEWFNKLGFNIHPKKSSFIPAQEIIFLGFVINSVSMTIRLTHDKKTSLRELCMKVLGNSFISIRRLASLIGKFTASFPGVRYGPLHYRDLEREKVAALKLNKGNFDKNMCIGKKGCSDISWWVENIMDSFAAIHIGNPNFVMETDACKTGWGAVCNGSRAHGGWSFKEAQDHINVLELRAILLGLKSHARNTKDSHILVMCDNVTAVCSLNKMGSVKSPQCDKIVREIWRYIISNDNWLTVSYIPGKENIEADLESRRDNNKEWMLDPVVFNKIIKHINISPTMDLFASRLNFQLKPFVSFRPDPEALHINAFTINWGCWSPFYAFPPFPIITKVLNKVLRDQAEGIIIVPNWPNQIWFPVLMRMITSCPIILHSRKSLLLQKQDPSLQHPLLPKMRLLVCSISGCPWKNRDFLKRLSTLSSMGGVKGQNDSTPHQSKNLLGTVVKGVWIPFLPL